MQRTDRNLTSARVHRSGFTLLELMMVLALVGLVLATSRMLFSQVLSTNAAIAAEATNADARAAGARTLRSLLRNADVTADSAGRFSGDGHVAKFTTRCPTNGGWLEPCRVTLTLTPLGDSSTIVAQLPSGEAVPLLTMYGVGELRYLDRAARDTTWLVTWGTSIVLPTAVAIVIGRDTLMLPAGDGNG